MSQTIQSQPFTVDQDEKVVQLMVYVSGAFYRGEVVAKQLIRVSTWLRMNTAPDHICLYNVKGMITTVAAPKLLQYAELHLPTPQIQALHLVPPYTEALDYDATEPNRRMQAVVALLGSFQMEGCMRLTGSLSLKRYLETTREKFTSLYDVKISNLVVNGMSPVTVPFVLVRQEAAIFGMG